MQIINTLEGIRLSDTAITVGKFDGIHNGHQLIFDRLRKKKKQGLKTVVFTFTKAPRQMQTDETVQYIFTEAEKYHYYELMDVDILVEYEMSKEFLSMSPRTFVKEVLVDTLGMKYICAGTDFRFGRERQGDARMLKELGSEYGFAVDIIEKKKYHAEDISSTRIRQLIKDGQMEDAHMSMGHPYCIIGTIVHGKQLGRQVGMPTINLIPPKDKLLPPNGVYAARIYLGGKEYHGITNVGCKPTVSSDKEMTVETYILNFNQDVYGQKAMVELLCFIRPEKKFPSLEAVKEQVDKDIKICKKLCLE